VGLGSNEGDRLAALRAARAALDRSHRISVTAASSVYETAPQGEVLEQRDFLNAVLAIDTDLAPEGLLELLKQAELDLGRVPGGDVDLLLLGDIEQTTEGLALPHPGITTRRFVLEPLLELEPDLTLSDGTPLAPLLDGLREQSVKRVGPL
jgi:2-amino-4-hydroxy-6-hydroxymethyldihydropteridine diphosphokinase